MHRRTFFIRFLLYCVLCLAVMMTACGKNNPDEAGGSDYDFSNCNYITEEMYTRAVSFPEGDLTRIAAAMRKAQDGQAVTIGVIGGSITQGCLASKSDFCYASLIQKWWKETFPDTEVTLINAGVGGTSSYLGVHRVDEDLLAYNPDFVVVEFSVNDANTPFYKKSYDNLVYRIMKDEHEPAVMLLFMTMEDGTSAQSNDALIGYQYNLPMISYQNAVMQELQDGTIKWDEISPDNIHPNDTGHGMVGELFSAYLSKVYQELDTIPKTVTPFEQDIFTSKAYLDGVILDNQDIEPTQYGSFEKKTVNDRFPQNWVTATGEESIIFTVKAANIGIMYQKYIDGSGGQYEVYVDDMYVYTLDADFSGGWGNYGETTEVYSSQEIKEHKIEIRKKEGSTGNAFAIMGLLIS